VLCLAAECRYDYDPITMLQSRHTRLLVLLLILLLAASLRIIHIDLLSLWIDEGFTWNLTQYGAPFLILRQDVHPPLYFLMADLWVAFTGTSVLAMRYFSVLPGMLSIALVYQLAREIAKQRNIKNHSIPVIAALLMALADAEIFLAQEVRSYTWHVLFTSLSMWGFLRWQRLQSRHWLILWILSTTALVYTFYLGAFVGVAQALYALLFLHKRQRPTAIGGLMIAAVSLLPWLLYTLPEQSGNLSFAEWIRLDAFAFWFHDFRIRYFSQQWALIGGLCALGLITMRYSNKDRNPVSLHPLAPTALLLFWLLVPLVLTLIINEYIPLYQPRRVSQIVPAIAMLTAFGLGNLRQPARTFLLFVIVVYSLTSVDFWRFKQAWRDMAQDTAVFIAEGTPMLFELGGDDYAPRYHYGQVLNNSHDFLFDNPPVDNANTLIGLTTWRQLEPQAYEAGLPAIIDSQQHWWLFYWSSDEGALFWLDQFEFVRTATFSVDFNPDVFLYRYDRLPDEALLRYDNGMVLRDALLHRNLYVELLWSTETALDADYTTSVFLLDAQGQKIAQLDSQPFLNQRPTSTWTTTEVVYDPKHLVSTSGGSIAPGTYQVGVTVYSIVDGDVQIVEATGGNAMTIIGEMVVTP